MAAADDERAPVKRPPVQPRHLYHSAAAPFVQHRPLTWRELADVLLGVALAFIVAAAVVAVAAALVARALR